MSTEQLLVMLLQADMAINWTQFGVAGGVIFVVFIFLVFILKIVPGIASTWKEVKLAEIGVREQETVARGKEAESRAQQANGFSQLAGALSQMSGVLRDVVIEQRRETDKVRLLQRVAADTSDNVIELMQEVTDEMAALKEAVATGKEKHGTQAKQTPTT